MPSLNAPLVTRHMWLGGTAVTAIGALALASTMMVKTSGEIAGHPFHN
jgi:hypothetical protein